VADRLLLARGRRAPQTFAGVTALGIAAARDRVRADVAGASAAVRFVYAATGAYAALFVFAAVLHYVVLETPAADLGHMVQAVWNTQHGHFLEATSQNGHLRNRLGYHVDPFLLVFVPLLWIWSSPLLLPVVQVLAVASGALPVFWLARKHLDSPRAGAHVALAYLLYPATQFNAFTITSSFHSVAIAVPLILYAIWFLDEDRLVAFSAVALIAFTTKEEIPLAVGCLGIWYAVRKGHRLFGLGVFAVGLAVTLFNFLWVIPHFSPSGADPFAGRYRAVGGTPGGIAHKLFTDPGAIVHEVATGHKAAYLVLLLVPFLGLWLLEPLLFLGAVPDLAINLLSSFNDQTVVKFHWTGGIVPFVVSASIFGAKRFKRHADHLTLWVFAAAAAVAIYSPITLASPDVRLLGSPLVAAKAHAVDLIPKGAPVSASNQLGSHLSERRDIYTFPYVRRARWIVVDVHDPSYGDPAGYERVLQRYESDAAWRIVFSSHGVVVLHKLRTGT
jgi:uncharacterized membrane protein